MPSERILEQKKEIVNVLAEKMEKAVAGVMVDYRGLTVEQDTKLRNELRAAGVEYTVVKNTLTRFAANRIGYTEFDEILNGPTALALSYDDVVTPAKVLAGFAEKNDALEEAEQILDHESIHYALTSCVDTGRYTEAIYEMGVIDQGRATVALIKTLPGVLTVSMVDCRKDG